MTGSIETTVFAPPPGGREGKIARTRMEPKREHRAPSERPAGAGPADQETRSAMSEPSESIEAIIDQLNRIVIQTKAENSPLGYFAALYRKVTLKVKSDIDDGLFEDNARMERLDVIFANRYLAAYDAHRAGRTPTQAWAYSFAVAQQWWPIVLQHLLLGMNAHINLDLGIAAARVAPGVQLADLKGDFDRINTVLAALVGDVQAELARIWPLLRLLNRNPVGAEKILVNFSMEKARDAAWDVARQLAPLDRDEQERRIALLDDQVTVFSRIIRHPGSAGRWITRMARLGERGSVASRIAILE